MLTVIVEDFRARPARAGVAHRPEIVGSPDADDPPLREAGDLLPQVEGLVVLGVDGDGQPLGRDLELLGDQIPGELDGPVLEVVAEREIAEHFEKRMMPCRVADIVEVIVLAAGAHAFLRGDGALIGPPLEAGEDVLELYHPGIGEHQRGVVARHERRGRHDLVTVGREVIEECRSDLVDAAHLDPLFIRSVPLCGAAARLPESHRTFRDLVRDPLQGLAAPFALIRPAARSKRRFCLQIPCRDLVAMHREGVQECAKAVTAACCAGKPTKNPFRPHRPRGRKGPTSHCPGGSSTSPNGR